MKHKITAAVLALLAAAFVWQAFAQTQTPCHAACKAKYDECMKEVANEPQDSDEYVIWKMRCDLLYGDCLRACK